MILPRKLYKGNTIGLVTTSFPVSEISINRSIHYLKTLGFNVKLGRNANRQFGFLGGLPKQKSDDIMEMFADDSISAIFVTGGGRTANHVLPLLNYELIKNHPKIFMGLSNSTIIANTITALTNLITFHGPTGYNFGEEKISLYTESEMLRVLMNSDNYGIVKSINKIEVLKKGKSSIVNGKLFGGHLLTNRTLIGTEYAPNWSECILFFEDCLEELHDFDDTLMHFQLSGVLNKINGLMIGLPFEVFEKSFDSKESMQDIILRICKNYDFPILYGFNIGHTKDKTTIPIGAVAEINTNVGIVSINQSVLIN